MDREQRLARKREQKENRKAMEIDNADQPMTGNMIDKDMLPQQRCNSFQKRRKRRLGTDDSREQQHPNDSNGRDKSPPYDHNVADHKTPSPPNDHDVTDHQTPSPPK